ncbi:hypothetical protein PLICRDRAFT_46294 [Plicaturopsis crispa FD-325 SS-3]|uniref:Uncharacterized protein n=1 Tax=Plicaturopsis crispa FD-325 SS-3 TaxID=944288 RepID=A0A0C9SXH0_PLICR|nr:hypothetical protein PLICRDRAFT_46294 [Plicaturopsis crispa FD-325 SS-3]
MYALKVPGSSPARYESRSESMAQLARDYHCNLQVDMENVARKASASDRISLASLLTKQNVLTSSGKHWTNGGRRMQNVAAQNSMQSKCCK